MYANGCKTYHQGKRLNAKTLTLFQNTSAHFGHVDRLKASKAAKLGARNRLNTSARQAKWILQP
jgi:hypothetical protein